ncbi:AI-2E family transporter [Candidatus Woesearchaeota archaeon]|nr:AI-2E family transporter [Candidatus Woesearchaeota archaeon]
MEKKEFNKYYLLVFLAILSYLAYLIIKPYIAAILSAAILAYLFYPLHKKIRNKIKSERISALFVTLVIILIIFIPLGFIANSLFQESVSIINNKQLIEDTKQIILSYTSSKELSHYISEGTKVTSEYIKRQASVFILSVANTFLSLFIAAFALYYFLIIGEYLIKNIREALPIKKKDELLTHIGDSIFSILYGSFVTAIIMFLVSLIGFKLIGINNPFIFSLIIAISVFIPLLGPAVIWGPLAVFKYLQNHLDQAIAIVILGLIVSGIETFLRPKIIGNKSKIHPIIVLLGVIGGIKIFGFIGLIIGPIILSVLITIIKEYFPLKNEIQS